MMASESYSILFKSFICCFYSLVYHFVDDTKYFALNINLATHQYPFEYMDKSFLNTKR